MTDHLPPDLSRDPDQGRAARLFQVATSDLVPDVDRLVQGGVARGRTLRRRRRAGTSLAAAAVVAIVGVAASAGSGLLPGNGAAPSVGFADNDTGTSTADRLPPPEAAGSGRRTESSERAPSGTETADPGIDSLVVVSAEDIPATVEDLLAEGTLGEIRRDASYGVVDERQKKIVHFMWDGTLTTFIIERADSLAGCRAQARSNDAVECVTEDGVDLLRYGPAEGDGVSAQSVTAWVHGYAVTAMSYNAAEGKDAPVVTAEPPISMDSLARLVTDEVWFGE